MLDQNDPQTARHRVEVATKASDWPRAYRAARRWFDIAPFDMRAAEALATAAVEVSRPSDAVAAYRVLAVLRPGQSEGILLRAMETLARSGHAKEAETLAKHAREADVSEAKIRQALEVK